MPAELPIFEWYGDRRAFMGGGLRLGAGGLIYAATAPLLVGRAESAQGEIPERYFTLTRDGWENERQLEFTEIATPLFAMLVGNRLIVNDKTVELPFAPESPSPVLAFSPGGDYLAVWAKHESARSQVLHRVSVFDLSGFEEKPFIEQTFSDSHCYLKWAQNGRHLLVNISPGGILPPRYPYGPMGNLDIYTYVYDAQTGREIIGLRGLQGLSISPDGRFIVASDRQNQNFLYDVMKQNHTVYIDPAPSVFDWSPDGKFLAGFLGSGEVIKSEGIGNRNILFEEITGGYQLILLDAASGERVYAKSIGHPASTGVRFTPDGKRLLFMDGTTGADKLAVLNLSTGDVERKIDNVSVGSDTPFLSLEQNVSFPSRDVLAVLGGSIPPYLDFVDLNTGQVRREEIVRIAADAPVISRDGFISEDTLGLWDYSGTRGVRGHKHYLYNFLTKTPIFVNEEASDFGKGIAFGISSAKDGELFETRDESFVIKDGRKHFVGPAAVELFAAETSVRRMSGSSLIEKVPRSENKLDFGAGDILVGPGGRSWFLQNGGRYEIPGRVEDFVQSRHKNMKAFEVPGWVLEKIQIKEMPSRFFEDQYGRLIDGYAARLLFFIAGWGSDSEDVVKAFSPIIKKLPFPPEQTVFGSYNFAGGRPNKYESRHSKQFTGLSRDAVRYNLGWLKQRAPLAQMSVCGHSQGADMGVHAAITHADFVSQMIAICGPLKGIDKAFVNRIIDLDELGNILGDAAGFYIDAGDDPNYGEQIEMGAQVLARRNVELYTFGEFFDGLVKPEVAILRNSKQELNGRKIDLLWRTNITTDGLRAHGILLTHEPFIELLAQIIGRP